MVGWGLKYSWKAGHRQQLIALLTWVGLGVTVPLVAVLGYSSSRSDSSGSGSCGVVKVVDLHHL